MVVPVGVRSLQQLCQQFGRENRCFAGQAQSPNSKNGSCDRHQNGEPKASWLATVDETHLHYVDTPYSPAM